MKRYIDVVQVSRKEKSINSALKNDILKLGGLCEKPKYYKTGWPDLMVLIPGGHFWFVESKRPKGGKYSERQLLVHRELRELDFRVRLVWDNTSKNNFLTEIKMILKNDKCKGQI